MYQALKCNTCDGDHWVYLCKACAVVHDGEMCGSWEQRTKHWLTMVKKSLGSEGVPIFLTFTFKGRYPGPQRGRKALQAYLHKVESLYLTVFCTEERGAENDRLHYHAVMMAKPDLSMADLVALKSAWEQGFARVEVCADADNSLNYVIKYAVKEADDASWFEFRKGTYKWL